MLLAFPTGPPAVHIAELAGTVGYGHPLVDEAVIRVKDSVKSLVSVLVQKAQSVHPVRQLVLIVLRNISAKRTATLVGLVTSAGLKSLRIGAQQDRPTAEQVSVGRHPDEKDMRFNLTLRDRAGKDLGPLYCGQSGQQPLLRAHSEPS